MLTKLKALLFKKKKRQNSIISEKCENKRTSIISLVLPANLGMEGETREIQNSKFFCTLQKFVLGGRWKVYNSRRQSEHDNIDYTGLT